MLPVLPAARALLEPSFEALGVVSRLERPLATEEDQKNCVRGLQLREEQSLTGEHEL